jgi:hypothetical protein
MIRSGLRSTEGCVFRANLTTDSDVNRPPNPTETIH